VNERKADGLASTNGAANYSAQSQNQREGGLQNPPLGSQHRQPAKQNQNPTYMRGSETRLLHRPHTPEDAGSSPAPASNTTTYIPSHVRSKEVNCPQCGTQRVWKDGLRYTFYGEIQRYICRSCGYRFSHSENSQLIKNVQKLQTEAMDPASSKGSEWSEGLQRVHTKAVYRPTDKPLLCRVGAAQTTGAKNLAEMQETRTQENPTREGTTLSADVKGKIVELARQLQKIEELARQLQNNGRSESTILNYSQYLQMLVRCGANLYDPESVKAVIARRETWGIPSKLMAINAYAAFASFNGIRWNPPNYKQERKLPFIPLEKELDALISACSKRTAALLKLLKETGMRIGEACRLKWVDLDNEHNTITLNAPEKGSQPRMFKVSATLVAMLNALPKQNEKIFGSMKPRVAASNFYNMRKGVAFKLQNPRINSIHLHTFRHWHATMEYSKTKDILHVMKRLGHKRIENTLLYTQLVNFESDEYHSAVAENMDEAKKLIEVGFEYVCTHQNLMLFRKRK